MLVRKLLLFGFSWLNSFQNKTIRKWVLAWWRRHAQVTQFAAFLSRLSDPKEVDHAWDVMCLTNRRFLSSRSVSILKQDLWAIFTPFLLHFWRRTTSYSKVLGCHSKKPGPKALEYSVICQTHISSFHKIESARFLIHSIRKLFSSLLLIFQC